MSNAISKYEDIIDVRDIIARIEDLEPTVATLIGRCGWLRADDVNELQSLYVIMADLCGKGGDEEWRGDWYPVTMIRDTHFEDYAQELAEDCSPFPYNSPEGKALQMWPYRCIDWAQAASELKEDYTSVEFDGVTYWVR